MVHMIIDPQDFGAVKQQTETNGILLAEINGKMDAHLSTSLTNKINLRWVWASLCGLAVVFASGFLFLYSL